MQVHADRPRENFRPKEGGITLSYFPNNNKTGSLCLRSKVFILLRRGLIFFMQFHILYTSFLFSSVSILLKVNLYRLSFMKPSLCENFSKHRKNHGWRTL